MSLHKKTEQFSTFEDLIEIEKETGVKHELIDGQIYAMAGGSLNHSEISLNLQIALKNAIGDKNCRVYNSDAMLRIKDSKQGNYYHPDAMVKCGVKDNNQYVEDPELLAEVLSPSTENFDQNGKLSYYLKTRNLKGYLILKSDESLINLWYQQDNILMSKTFKENETVKINDWIEFPVNDVYADLKFEKS